MKTAFLSIMLSHCALKNKGSSYNDKYLEISSHVHIIRLLYYYEKAIWSKNVDVESIMYGGIECHQRESIKGLH